MLRIRLARHEERLVLLLLGIAFCVRAWAARSALFCDDESMFWATGVDVAHGISHPEVGPPISGSPAGLPGPLFYYLTAVPQLFTRHPMASAYLVIILNVIGLALIGSTVKIAMGARARLIYLAITAISPWTIVYADRLWPGNLFFFLCALAVHCLVKMERASRSRMVAVLAFMLVAGAQIHLSIAHLWFFSAVTLLVLRPRIHWRALGVGFLAGCVTYYPYLAHELRTNFSNTKLIMHFAPGGARTWTSLMDLFVYFFGFATLDVTYLMKDGYWHSFSPLGFWTTNGIRETSAFYLSVAQGSRIGAGMLWALLVAGVALTIAGVPLFFLSRGRRKNAGRSLKVAFFSACFLGIPLLYWLSRKGGYAHYVTIVAPFAFVPTTAALDRLFARRPTAYFAAIYLSCFAIAACLLTATYYRGSGSPVLEQIQIVRFIEEKTGGTRPFQLLLRQRGGYPQSYGLIADRYWRAPWRSRPFAADVFTVMFTKDAPPPAHPEDELRLDHITVQKTR